MSRVYTSAEQLIGKTPLLELTRIEKEYELQAKILAKLEYFNPAGSVKDRVAKAILDDAESTGRLKPDTVIIEPTSGNTGIGLASVAAARGYRMILVMPDTMSVERCQLMKAQNPDIKIVAVEPVSSAVLSTGIAGSHKIQGIGAGFVPDILNTSIYDEVITVENDDAFATGKLMGHREGVLVVISSGAALWAAIQLAKRAENKGKTIVVLMPDTGDRYLSTPLFAE